VTPLVTAQIPEENTAQDLQEKQKKRQRVSEVRQLEIGDLQQA